MTTLAVTIALAALTSQGLLAQTIRINCGGSQQNYTASDQSVWVPDRYYTGGDLLYTGHAVTGTQDSTLYRTARQGLYTDFGYQIPVANGNYNVTLRFAEILYSAKKQRIFNLSINGSPVLTNFDLFAAAGGKYKALDKTFPVSVNNGVIDLEFVGVKNRGIVNAIEVDPASGSSNPPSSPPSSPPGSNDPPSDPPPSGSGPQFYVAPNGSPNGDGSIGNPWDLATALSNPSSVTPGSTIWLRGGTYGRGGAGTQFVSHLAGTASNPIIVRQYPGERATVNGGIGIYGPYTWYWGFEVMSQNPDRGDTALRYECMDTYEGSTGVKLINLVLHDCLQGIGLWADDVDGEAYGNLIYYNGESGETRGLGHAIYTQNQTGTKTISDNIMFDQFDIGLQAYGSGSAYVQNYNVDGNVSFNNGSLYGGFADNIIFAGGHGITNVTLTNNYTYYDPQVASNGQSRLGWEYDSNDQNGSIVSNNNYWIGGFTALEVWQFSNVTMTGNVVYADNGAFNTMLSWGSGQSTSNYNWDNNAYYGSDLFRVNGGNQYGFSAWQNATGVDAHSTYSAQKPTATWVFVRPNKYEAGRANIIIYNWPLAPAVNVDLSSVLSPGDNYVIRDVFNFFGSPLVTGTYNGSPVSIPMQGLPVSSPVGTVPRPPTHTAPEFGVFIVQKQ